MDANRRLALLGVSAAALLASSQARADTAFTSFAFLATGGTRTRTDPDRWGDVTNVMDFTGIDPTGVGDSTAAIQAAIDYAATQSVVPHGGAVFFPPGTYKVSAPLINDNAATQVRLLGANRASSYIFGTVDGYIIDQSSNNAGIIYAVEHLHIYNAQLSGGIDFSVGAIRFNGLSNGLIANCLISGWNGIASYASGFHITIMNCDFSGPNGGQIGSVGCFSSQGTVISCSATGCYIGFVLTNGVTITGSRNETCSIGVLAGMGVPYGSLTPFADNSEGVVTPVPISAISWSSGSGGVATVTSSVSLTTIGWTSGTKTIQVMDAGAPLFATGINTDLYWLPFQFATYVDDTHFTYPLPHDPGAYSGSGASFLFFTQLACRFASVSGYQTERSTISFLGLNISISSIENFICTATVGPNFPGASVTGNGTTATVTMPAEYNLDRLGWITNSTTRPLTIQGGIFSLNDVKVTGTRTSNTTFTYLSAVVGTEASVDVSFNPHNGFRLQGPSVLTVQSCFNNIADANFDGTSGAGGIDMYCAGSDFNPYVTFIDCQMTGTLGGTLGWIMPKATSKANVQYINCDNPTGSTNDAAGSQSGMNFADLPGQSGVIMTTPIEGMTYDIVNCNAATFLATAAGAGTGATAHRRVRYNAATPAWQVIG
jgi:hypothetical protein